METKKHPVLILVTIIPSTMDDEPAAYNYMDFMNGRTGNNMYLGFNCTVLLNCYAHEATVHHASTLTYPSSEFKINEMDLIKEVRMYSDSVNSTVVKNTDHLTTEKLIIHYEAD